ncbi:MAG: ATP-dependent DNA helicase RecQ, partial [Flavobacteriales bacterium]|jgi:ATP-dependent DNA helicase RecQ
MSSPKEILKEYWGYDSFRDSQEEIINSVLEGSDTFALLPTGGGKSLCFQIPGLIKEGICIVVSPLIALMEDQVNQLRSRNIIAVSIHSGLHKTEIDRILDNCIYGNTKFLYVSPERLKTEIFQERLKKMNVSVVAIDESHCVSQWGHDFRPAYLEIANIRETLPNVPFIALTATATEKVQKDITEHLALKKVKVFSKSFARENIRFVVRNSINKHAKILEICTKIGGSTIVYANTRKHTKDYADLLNSNGIKASFYHAGLKPEDKTRIQEEWITGKVRVICATNAFGMGIDKANVRLVIHPHIPSEPEAFYQEAGRAGRDGKTSLSVLIYNSSDLENLDRSIALKYPEPKLVKRVYSLLFQEYQIAYGTGENFRADFDISGFSIKHGININTLHYSLKILEYSELIALQNYGRESSKLMFKISHTGVYKFQVANPNLDDLLTVIIRSYGGIFEHMVAIDEMAIAQRTKLPIALVNKYLQNLVDRDVIYYEAKSRLPSVRFLRSRVQETYLSFPKEIYSDKQSRDKERVEAMKHYVSRVSCRMNVLLEYFGEKRKESCGICDICSSLNQIGVSQKEFDQIHTAIKIALKTSSLTPTGITEKLPKFPPEKTADILRWMTDNKEVILNSEEKYELKTN